MNFEKLLFRRLFLIDAKNILLNIISSKLLVPQTDFSKKMQIIKLMNLLTRSMSFHPLIHSIQKSTLVDIGKEKITKLMQLRELKFDHLVSLALKLLQGLINCIHQTRCDPHLMVSIYVTYCKFFAFRGLIPRIIPLSIQKWVIWSHAFPYCFLT